MEFYKIKNNTLNPLIINGTYMGAQSEIILSDDFLDQIDSKYFDSEILINNGTINVDQPIYINPPKTLSTVIKERNLDANIRETLSKANETYSVIKNKIGYDELKPSIKNILDSLTDTTFKTYWKDPVLSDSLLPSYESGINYNGDIRLSLDSNTLYRWTDSEKKWSKISYQGTGTQPSSEQNSGPITIIKERFILDEFFAYDGQQYFNLRGKYVVGSNDLQVILNGIVLTKDDDYIEVDEKKVQILFPLKFEDYVVFTITGKESVPYIVVEKQVVDVSKNKIILNHSIGSNPSVIQVFLNGISVSFGEKNDYVVLDNKTISFNYYLEPKDVVMVRFEHSSLADNFENQFAQTQRIYMNLAKQIQYLREIVEK